MKEISILIEDDDYIDSLIVALARQGYEVYFSWDKTSVCFMVDEGSIGGGELHD